VSEQRRCLCIIARDRLRGSDFVAALEASLGPDDHLEVIVDRRSGEISEGWDRAEDRRRRPQVDQALRANGFAVVQAPAPGEERSMRDDWSIRDDDGFRDERGSREERAQRNARPARGDRSPLSMLIPSSASRLEPSAEDYAEPYADDDDDAERLESIRSFRRARSRSLLPWLVAGLAVVAVTVFFLSPWGQSLSQSLAQRNAPATPTSSQPPAPTPDASSGSRSADVAEKSHAPEKSGAADKSTSSEKPGAPDRTAASERGAPEKGGASDKAGAPERAGVPEKPGAAQKPPSSAPANEGASVERSTRGSGSSVASEPQPLPSRDAATSAAPRGARAPSAENSAPPRAAAEDTARGRARSSETSRPTVSEPPPRQVAALPAEPGSRLVSPRFAGLPRVELSREPGTGNGTYAVRIVDPAGKPLGDAEVLLLARMPDGTVENVRMDFSPDHGTYRGSLRSTPLDMRIRVITGDKRVEIPLGP